MTSETRTSAWTIGVDTGGTFTDVFAYSNGGEARRAKVPSTPPDFSAGIIAGIRELGIEADDVRVILHGTTVTTNAVITKSGARTALINTEGFRDLLELRRGNREDLYDISWDPPDPLVPRYNRLEVRERVNYKGEVVTPLDVGQVANIARVLRKRGVEAVGICLMNAYLYPEHEQTVREVIAAELPEVYIGVSSEILREPPEFERTATVATNAYVAPVLRTYIANLELALAEGLGFERELLLMHSGGGLMTAEAARKIPARTITSGPAAGAMAAAAIGIACGCENVISFDMGGTSADIAVVHDGRARVTTNYSVEWGLPVQFPAIDLVTVGAGGGSIAWLDQAGYPRSGPMSAGAEPGPACYGQGGTEPTNTDANLVLGRLAPDCLLAGKVPLDASLAERAIAERIADPLGLSVSSAADGIIRISNATMARAIRRMTVERGFDPREFALLAFGGAGPLHAVDLARELQIGQVIVPPSPGVTSALGLLVVDLSHDFSQSIIRHQDEVEHAELEATFARLEAEATETLRREGVTPDAMRLERQLDLRYVGQVRALSVPVDSGLTPELFAAVGERFHAAHQREYRYSIPDAAVETYIARVSATGIVNKPDLTPVPAADGPIPEPLIGKRQVYFFEADAFLDAAIYERSRLRPGAVILGPAVVEQLDSTTVIPPGTRTVVDDQLNLRIEIQLGDAHVFLSGSTGRDHEAVRT